MGGLTAALMAYLATVAPPADVFVDLPILPKAVDVVRHPGPMPAVEYDVREQYPAPQTIGALVDAMSKAGWRLAEVGGFKGTWPHPSDWPIPSRPKQLVPTHFWRGRWVGKNGREAELRLTYACPMEASGMHSVWVHIVGDVHGPQEAARRKAARDRILADCESGVTRSPDCEK